MNRRQWPMNQKYLFWEIIMIWIGQCFTTLQKYVKAGRRKYNKFIHQFAATLYTIYFYKQQQQFKVLKNRTISLFLLLIKNRVNMHLCRYLFLFLFFLLLLQVITGRNGVRAIRGNEPFNTEKEWVNLRGKGSPLFPVPFLYLIYL